MRNKLTFGLSDLYEFAVFARDKINSMSPSFADSETLVPNGKFQENVHYKIGKRLGKWTSRGICHEAITITSSPFTFCRKKCRYEINEVLALQMAKKHDIPQIVSCFWAILQGRGALIFMERMAGGTLEDYVENKGSLPEETCAAFGKDLILAVKFAHEDVGIVHGDIHGNSFPRNHLQLLIGSHS
ncbi:PREDICTED: mitogen-activated protein kinase kinase 1-like [Acropora digitifera]|uniref:mitogen-activated protein kinase kinase 1-like n=1 Tax=Acropora digitifera TaxID=70779 RepID=UPI000779F5EE|nr:PREDICTED: mitogen-activated protein kinase kinase 1-like [Acropora digitifera]